MNVRPVIRPFVETRPCSKRVFPRLRYGDRLVRPARGYASEASRDASWSTGRAIAFGALTAAAAGTSVWYVQRPPEAPAASKTHPKHEYASTEDMKKGIAELQELMGEDGITTDDDELHRHGFSDWSTTNADTLPVAVAYPKSTEDVSKIAKICSRWRIPMVPFSGGSSLEANFSAPFGGVSIDFAYMDEVLAIHPEDMDVVVQPSVPWMSLNEQIKEHGLFFPVDPGPSAQIGGMVGTGCSGTNAVRYGTMKDWVVNLTVVLADGSVIKTRRRPRKSSAGYNLNGLFVGSEGTLGLVTEITLKLAVIPQETSVAVVTFPSIRHAASAASNIMRSGVPIAAMEIMDDVQMRVVNQAGGSPKQWQEVPTMFFKFSGTKAGVEDNVSLVKAIAAKNQSGTFEFTMDGAEKDALWAARKNSLWSMLAMRTEEGQQIWSTDVAVPFSRLPDLIEATKKDLDALGLFASALGHIGDGNFHTSICWQAKNPEETERVKTVVKKMVDNALEMEGTCTGEHGIGIGKKDALLRELGPGTVDTMKTIKAALDPLLIMNPGKIIDFAQ